MKREKKFHMSSKKTTHTISIQLDKFTCPICKRTGEYHKDDYETTCECGLVITTAYPYTAGQKYKTLTEYLQEQKKERRKQKWK